MQLNFICPTNREIESKGVYYYMSPQSIQRKKLDQVDSESGVVLHYQGEGYQQPTIEQSIQLDLRFQQCQITLHWSPVFAGHLPKTQSNFSFSQ